jgi:hypothetical protein
MPFSIEALAIVLAAAFIGMMLAVLVDFYPTFKIFVDNVVDGVKELKKFKRQKPF